MGKFWEQHASKISISRFRGVEQYLHEQPPTQFEPMLRHIRTLPVPYLDSLREDDAFGIVSGDVTGICVSRDLYDSVVELDFLSRRCGLDLNAMRVLDIGAGYGRLTHRLCTMFPRAHVICTDPIPISRQICLTYLSYRGVANAWPVLPEHLEGRFDLAMSVHTWPECSREEIRGWLKWLAENQVPRLFVVPHFDHVPDLVHCHEDGRSFKPDIEEFGYRLTNHWRGPDCWARDFYLYSLSAK